MNTFANRSLAVALILAATAATAAVADGPAKPAAEATGPRQVSGRVLGPDGKPVAGAKLFTYSVKARHITTPADFEVSSLGTSDADGRFTASVSPMSNDSRSAYLMARAPGLGVDWLVLDHVIGSEPLRDQTLRLTEDVPISGRVVNAEGKPLVGLSVAVGEIQVPLGNKLDDYLAEWKGNPLHYVSRMEKSLPGPFGRTVAATTTDNDGRFTLRGAGSERGVTLLVSGGRIARSRPLVITRRGLDPNLYNDPPANDANDGPRESARSPRLYGPDLTLVAEAGKVVTGVVSDAATGAPIPGCHVYEYGDPTAGTGDRTDARGRYRLEGLPKNAKGYEVSVTAPGGSAFLDRRVRADDTEGYAPVQLDVGLGKGAVVTGRVVDKQTGKGVPAILHVELLAGNKLFGTKPEYGRDATEYRFKTTDRDGRFRFATLPGPGIILAQAVGEPLFDRRGSRYRLAVPDPEHKDVFRRLRSGSWQVHTAANGTATLGINNAAKVIDVKDDGETEVVVTLDPGVTGKIEVQDAAGRPLPGARVAGLTADSTGTFRLSEATAPVYGLAPGEPRTIVIYHPETKLAGALKVRGDEEQPVVARLAPVGRLTGRLLDEDGKPLAGVGVSLYSPQRSVVQLFAVEHRRNPVVADKDGRFTVEDLVPGLPFRLQYRKDKQTYTDNPPSKPLNLKPGEALDLGDVTLRRTR